MRRVLALTPMVLVGAATFAGTTAVLTARREALPPVAVVVVTPGDPEPPVPVNPPVRRIKAEFAVNLKPD
ncbi:MAG TPA: hypothetical protein VM597_28710, partial [Gemmataceae bacterium]|nr:hypothetical protein [Gemmataceae bacterium]